jgi:tRNA-uridine 2-sulfurtransferase
LPKIRLCNNLFLQTGQYQINLFKKSNVLKIVVGLSGGVDSSVAAYLLKKQGHEVIGLFMRNWNDASVTLEDECPWIQDSKDALLVAEKLGIPFQVIDMSQQYKERIVDYMFYEYKNGRTPNPDVLCNKEVKFDLFLAIALKLGAEAVATGHYCQKKECRKNRKTIYQLLAGKDKNKDQSYFLCQLNQYQLSKALFPIGELTKPEVRKIAKENDLITAQKKDSQGLCFIGKVSLPNFLQQQLNPKQGEVICIDADFEWYKTKHKQEKICYKKEDGSVVGLHQGAHFYTKGQRKGLGIGGFKEPLFILDTDIENNLIFVGEGKNHPGLYRNFLFIKNEEEHWLREDLQPKVGEEMQVSARIRYRQELQEAVLQKNAHGLFVLFNKPQFAIAEGQFVAFYINAELIASGVIS